MPVTVAVHPQHILVTTSFTVVGEAEGRAIFESLKGEPEQRPLVIIDLSQTMDIVPAGLRTLTRSLGTFTENATKVTLISGKEVANIIKTNGLDRLFQCVPTLADALPPGSRPGQGKSQTLEFLNTTLEAVTYTLKITCATEARACKSYLRGAGPEINADIAAIVGIVSTPFQGSLILAMDAKTYLKVMSRMLGQEFSRIDAEIRDGIAELLNMVLGQAKITLNERGFAIKQAIPTVVEGVSLKMTPSSGRPSVIVPYATDAGEFYIELTTSQDVRK
jgi:chemotaxis protein CheX